MLSICCLISFSPLRDTFSNQSTLSSILGSRPYFWSSPLFNAASGLSMLPVETAVCVIDEGPNVLGPPR